MTASRHFVRRAIVVVALYWVAGCAGGTTAAGSASPTAAASTASSTILPTTPAPTSTATAEPGAPAPESSPGKPAEPNEATVPPSDEITGFWVLGTITRDSAGPCYDLRADDGREITLYSRTAGPFTARDRIRARLVSPVRSIYCGSAEALRLLETKRAG